MRSSTVLKTPPSGATVSVSERRRNPVEEKIFALQNRKKELTASLVERETDEPLLETLSFEEIESLLE